MLGAVLFDVEGEELTVVATDRYRMAVARTAVTGHDGERVQALVPLPPADAMRALLRGEEPVGLTFDGDRVSLESAEGRTAGQCLDQDFPDHRRLVRLPAGRRCLVDVAAFREALASGPVRTSDACKGDGGPAPSAS
ncbi:hypothetical protein [Streptomyces sp. NPDC048192]|uniref:DNA polymerase III subunit beta family protein n=1 Tax=Streptomyces sp. NPDC048192 TaxID=3365510 RepID=UPI0037167F01